MRIVACPTKGSERKAGADTSPRAPVGVLGACRDRMVLLSSLVERLATALGPPVELAENSCRLAQGSSGTSLGVCLPATAGGWEQGIGATLLDCIHQSGDWAAHASAAAQLTYAAGREWAVTLSPLLWGVVALAQTLVAFVQVVLQTLGWRTCALCALVVLGLLFLLWLFRKVLSLVIRGYTEGKHAAARRSRSLRVQLQEARLRAAQLGDFFITRGLPQTVFLACAVSTLVAAPTIPQSRMQPIVDVLDMGCKVIPWLYCLQRVSTWASMDRSTEMAGTVAPGGAATAEWRQLLDLEHDRHCLSLCASISVVEAAFATPLVGRAFRWALHLVPGFSNLALVRCIFRLCLVLPITRGDQVCCA